MADTMNVTGFKEMAAKLKDLGPKIARNGLRAAVSSGAGLIRDGAKARAPVETGTLKRAIAIKREKTEGPHVASYSVFVRQAKNGSVGQKNVAAYGKYDAYYACWVEFGTVKMSAKPFLRPSFEAGKEQAVDAIGKKLDERIQQEAAKK